MNNKNQILIIIGCMFTLIIVLVVILTSLTSWILEYGEVNEVKVKCYDRWNNEIKGVDCIEEQRPFLHQAILFWSAPSVVVMLLVVISISIMLGSRDLP